MGLINPGAEFNATTGFMEPMNRQATNRYFKPTASQT
jgi:hypothetical protein